MIPASNLPAILLLALVQSAAAVAAPVTAIRSEFISDTPPFASSHASTIVSRPNGELLAAWFGGSDEGELDVCIWLSRLPGKADAWTAPEKVAEGVMPDGKRYPCWNPVLVQSPDGQLLLFYKVGSSPSEWWGMMKTLGDDGKTWSNPTRLPDGFMGPVRNKPIWLEDGTLLCGSSTEHAGWQVQMEQWNAGKQWEKTKPLNDGKSVGAIQPTILRHANGVLQILCRNRTGGKILESWSSDQGKTWTALSATALPNPNSGIDAVTLRDSRHLLVYNRTSKGRSPLNVAVSSDGKTWRDILVLESEPGEEFSYPAIIQEANGSLVHITYTWKRKKIRHVVIDPATFEQGNTPE